MIFSQNRDRKKCSLLHTIAKQPRDLTTVIAKERLTLTAKPAECPRLAACPGGKVGLMTGTTNPESFEEIVEWAFSTLPQKVRDLPDFPGIQVVDEPPRRIGGHSEQGKMAPWH